MILDFVIEIVSLWAWKKVRVTCMRDSRDAREEPVNTISSAKRMQDTNSSPRGKPWGEAFRDSPRPWMYRPKRRGLRLQPEK